MITLPNLVQDFNIRHLTNSVLVGTMKFTLDQFDAFFTAQNPAPTRLAAQLTEFRAGYNRLNAAYALTRESLLTTNLNDLDNEGDSLYHACKETSEAAQRMTFMPAKKEAGDRVSLVVKKYKINTKENMVSEWSKMQQLCEEINDSTQLTADIATLGLTEAMARLTTIAELLRDTLTQRENELPSHKAMQQAREAIYLEYRALIDQLNAHALVDENVNRFATLILTLNRNIDYVRIHAMTNGGATDGSGESGQGQQTTDNGQQNGDNTGNNGQQTGDNTGNNGQQTGDNTGNNGQQTGDNTGNDGNDNPGGNNDNPGGDNGNDNPGGDINDGGLDD